MDKPTEEQWIEVLKWCGFTIGDYPEPQLEPDEKAWYDPEGMFFSGLRGLLDLDLNNLFRYAVPKVIDKIMAEHECSSDYAYEILFKMWLRELQLNIPHAADALFQVIYKVMEESDGNRHDG